MTEAYPWLHFIASKESKTYLMPSLIKGASNARQEKVRQKINQYIENNQLPLFKEAINSSSANAHNINESMVQDNPL